MKISSLKLMQWSITIAVFYFYFYSQVVALVGGKYCYPFLFAGLIFSLVALLIKRKVIDDYLGMAWLIILVFSTITNQGIRRKAWLWPLTFIMLIIMLFAMTTSIKWHKLVIKLLVAGSLIYCVATLLFFVLPGLYPALIKFWGKYPNGTEHGLYGYRAGLADNHSANGTYCIVAFLIAISSYFLEANRKKRRIWLGISAVSIFSVLLTTKRAHLLFGCFAALVCYYFSREHGKASRGFKLICVVVVGLLLFYYASNFIPVISDFMQGFEGQDDLSNGRYEYWMVALSYFKDNPLFGIGWLGFRYKTLGILAKGYVDAHNVYIQLLAESGIFGATIMMLIFVGTLAKTIFMLSKKGYSTDSWERRALCISLGMQIFCLTYGFTGNFLYDRTCFVYVFSCALCYSVSHVNNKSL